MTPIWNRVHVVEQVSYMLALLGVVVTLMSCGPEEPSVMTLQAEIRRACPVGSSLASVEDFVRRRGFEHSTDPTGTIHAIARNVGKSNFVTKENLQIEFHFDSNGRLKDVQTKMLYTGT